MGKAGKKAPSKKVDDRAGLSTDEDSDGEGSMPSQLSKKIQRAPRKRKVPRSHRSTLEIREVARRLSA